ncbi:MAG: hypothetical protein U5J96_00030 [Ignavibacteriaceae bacterium]|nr:hypothetical protein [Ignavibacteriaceae bacterium]
MKKKLYVNLSQESIKNSPEFDPDVHMTEDYEKVLFNYYGEDIKLMKSEVIK